MKLDRLILITLNGLARIFGVLAILTGIVFLVSAYAVKANRFLDIAIGLFLTTMGIAFLLIKSINAEQLTRMRRRMGRPGFTRQLTLGKGRSGVDQRRSGIVGRLRS
jgi:hypothetical protein